MKKLEIRFALLYGIGQTLPYDSGCAYYLDCPGTQVKPSIKNDFENAANYFEYPQKEVDVRLSMTFPDLTEPQTIVQNINLLDREYPGLFQWVGEVNAVKRALASNGVESVSKADIKGWEPFMSLMRERQIPMALHHDLGVDGMPFKNVDLLKIVLDSYSGNKIIWMHAGVSRELTTLDPDRHIALISSFLDTYPNLMIDLSWSVLADSYFNTPERVEKYVHLVNRYPRRFLAGTDFVAASHKAFIHYNREFELTSMLYEHVDDRAFRHIVLGQNYFDLMPGMADDYEAPEVCVG